MRHFLYLRVVIRARSLSVSCFDCDAVISQINFGRHAVLIVWRIWAFVLYRPEKRELCKNWGVMESTEDVYCSSFVIYQFHLSLPRN